MTHWLADNLLLYSVQILFLVLAAEALSRWILKPARLRLLHWHAVLLMILLLPIVQQLLSQPAVGEVTISSGPVQAVTGQQPSSPTLPWPEAILVMMGTGAALLLGRLVLGAVRIQLYRRNSVLLEYPHPEAEFRLSREVSGPITFGLLRPTILLPECFETLSPDAQDAIREHELAHVRRNDWLFALGEEFIRALLWFHPAVWWVLGHVQVAREQVVDEDVVRITGKREAYVEALLAIAGLRAKFDFVPAPLFLRKRHLAERVANLLEEMRMSKLRSIGYGTASMLTLLTVAATVSLTVPLRAWEWQQETKTPEPSSGTSGSGMKLLFQVPPIYPAEAKLKKIEGTVVLDVDVDQQGMVADARIVSGPVELRRAALQAVLKWQFVPQPQAVRTSVTLNFRLPEDEPGAAATTGYIQSIAYDQMPGNLRQRVEARLPVKEGDPISKTVLAAVLRVLTEIDTQLGAVLTPENTLQIRYYQARPLFAANASSGVASGAAGGTTTGNERPAIPDTIRVGGNVQASKIDRMVRPEYPLDAKAARIQGKVVLQVRIDKTGQIADIQLVSGHPILVTSAVAAVKQWTYHPTLLNGNPVDVITQVDVNFTLAP